MFYVVNNTSGAAEFCDTADEAGRFILGYDNHDWEVREGANGGYWLWRSRFGGGGRKGGMVKNLIYTPCADLAEAEGDILRDVVRYSDRYGFDVLTEAEWAAQFEADSDEIAADALSAKIASL